MYLLLVCRCFVWPWMSLMLLLAHAVSSLFQCLPLWWDSQGLKPPFLGSRMRKSLSFCLGGQHSIRLGDESHSLFLREEGVDCSCEKHPPDILLVV